MKTLIGGFYLYDDVIYRRKQLSSGFLPLSDTSRTSSTVDCGFAQPFIASNLTTEGGDRCQGSVSNLDVECQATHDVNLEAACQSGEKIDNSN